MVRRKKSSHGNSERWLVSYADLLTLLFAFFVVMFASTQSDKAKIREISRAVEKALQDGGRPPKQNTDAGGKALRPEGKASGNPISSADRLAAAVDSLEANLDNEVKHGEVSVHLDERGAVISLNAQAVFPSGGDTVGSAVYPLLAKVAATLNKVPNLVRLEGYTDSLPINNDRFRNNWELSAARSIAMLRILNEKYGVSRDRMAIVGYADTNAIGDNNTEEGRTRNRRVDLVILKDTSAGEHSPPR